MKDAIYLNNLFDYYGVLLTEKEQKYYKDYYFNDFSLKEISENYGISRNAIYKQIKESVNKLKMYEDKLKLYEKKLKICDIISNIDENTKNKIEELI